MAWPTPQEAAEPASSAQARRDLPVARAAVRAQLAAATIGATPVERFATNLIVASLAGRTSRNARNARIAPTAVARATRYRPARRNRSPPIIS